MIEIKVVSRFQGKVAVRDKYVKRALEEKQDLAIEFMRDVMIIRWQEIEKKIEGESKNPVPDNFSDESHFLIYFKWKPNYTQNRLFK